MLLAVQLDPKDFKARSNLAKALAVTNHPEEAVANARQAIEGARSAGQEPVAAQIADWLQSYESEQPRGGIHTPPSNPR